MKTKDEILKAIPATLKEVKDSEGVVVKKKATAQTDLLKQCVAILDYVASRDDAETYLERQLLEQEGKRSILAKRKKDIEEQLRVSPSEYLLNKKSEVSKLLAEANYSIRSLNYILNR